MFLWKWYLQYRYKKTVKRTEQLRAAQNERQRCLIYFNELTTQQFSLYEVGHGLAIVLHVPDLCVDHYIERIKRTQRTIERDKALNNDDFNWPAKRITVDQFLTSKTGFYQDAEQAVVRLRHAVLALCEAAAKLDQVDTGIQELNHRLLTKLFINLQQVAKALIEVSLTN